MAAKNPRALKSATVIRGLIRGDVNNWLYRHRRQIQGLIKKHGRVLTWAPFISQMEAEGVTRGSGKPLTPRAVADRWRDLSSVIEREEAAKALKPPSTNLRSRGPNVEPPSRPGVNLRPVRRGPLDAGYTPSEDAPPTYPATQPAAHPHGQSPPGARRTGEEKRAAVERRMREMDGYEPPPPPRGRVI